MKEAVSISSTPISVYYSINHGKMFKQVLISVISMCHSNKHNVLHVYLLEPCVPEYAPNVTKITEQEKQILKQVLLQANPDNKLIYLDCSDLCKKYLLSGPNENCWKNSKYKYPSLLYVRYLISFFDNIPDKILWLDSDTLVLGDLQEFWNLDMKEKEWAGRIDLFDIFTKIKWFFLGMSPFFQNGVMFLNMEKIRGKLQNLILNYKSKNYGFFGDMKVINKNCKKKKKLKRKFNEYKISPDTIIFHCCGINVLPPKKLFRKKCLFSTWASCFSIFFLWYRKQTVFKPVPNELFDFDKLYANRKKPLTCSDIKIDISDSKIMSFIFPELKPLYEEYEKYLEILSNNY